MMYDQMLNLLEENNLSNYQIFDFQLNLLMIGEFKVFLEWLLQGDQSISLLLTPIPTLFLILHQAIMHTFLLHSYKFLSFYKFLQLYLF